jgi:hypothetical protein
LHKVGLFRWNKEGKQLEKIDIVEIAPGVESDFSLLFENHGEKETEGGELIDYGKIAVRKSGECGRHIADITFNSYDYEACVSLSLNGNRQLKELVDEQKEFAITNLYMPKGRKWGKHCVFSVEPYEEGKETYIDLDQFLMTTEELEERDKKLNQLADGDIDCCCGFFRKKLSRK